MTTISQDLRFGSRLHKRILEACRARVKAGRDKHGDVEARWDEAEKRSFAYLPERDVDQLRRIEREGGKPQYTTIQLPYSYAILLTAHTYWSTVFLSRNPIHQFSARHGKGQVSTMAVEALMDYEIRAGEQIGPMFRWLYDAGKWGYGIIGMHWDREYARVSRIVEQQSSFAGIAFGPTKKVRIIEDIEKYAGNRIYNVRPPNFFHDPRVSVHDFQSGEYCGVYTTTNANRLIEGARSGKYINVDIFIKMANEGKELSEHTTGENEISNSVLDAPDPADFGVTHVEGKLAAASVKLYEMYIELIPEDWGLGKGNLPEKWMFVVDDNYRIVLAAAPLGAYHNRFPFAIIPIDFDAYNVFPRSMMDVNEPLQNTLDWLVNSHFYNVRKALNNQLVVDPSRVVMKDVLNPLPGNIIRARPQAYGTDLRQAVHQLQMIDITRSHMEDTNYLLQFGERVHGISDSVAGLSNPSSRRSATEVRSTNTFSISRLKTVAEYMSAIGWQPLAQMQLQNSQQYLDANMKLRRVGDLISTAGTEWIDVSPENIAGFYDYVPVDGTLPTDRLAQATLWRELLLAATKVPGLLQQFDVSKIFTYIAQLTGLRDINQFRVSNVQVVPDDAIAQQEQAGNVVKLGQRNPEDLPQPRQTQGMGQIL